MKKVLLLLLLFVRLSGANITNLEQAIMESNLAAVEKLLAEGMPISEIEQGALINLATEIARKRENLRAICETIIWKCVVEPTPKFNEMFEIRGNHGKKARIFLLLPIGCLLAVGLLDYTKIFSDSTLGIIFGVSTALSWGMCFYYIKKYLDQDDAIKAECRLYRNELWDNAIKIRQLLYKIVPSAPSFSLRQ